jgi:hypothetical protein
MAAHFGFELLNHLYGEKVGLETASASSSSISLKQIEIMSTQ